MAVRLRLTRLGRKKRPFYRIVAVDSRRRRDGAYLEKLGHYNPLTKPPEIALNEERALDWLLKGAQPTNTVKSLLSKKGVMLKFDLIRKGASQEKIDEEMAKLEVIRQEQADKAQKAEVEAKTKAADDEKTSESTETEDSDSKPEDAGTEKDE